MRLDDQEIQAIADAIAKRLAPSGGGTGRRLLDLEQAAEYISRTPRAVRALIAARAFPTVQADRRVFLDVRDLDKWIDCAKV